MRSPRAPSTNLWTSNDVAVMLALYAAFFWVALLGFVVGQSTDAHGKSAALFSPMQLVNVDHRPVIDLNGDWHSITDPYGRGLCDFHGKLRADGYFMNGKQEPDGEPVEYDFQKSPALHVPRDWNTQRESLFFYEGPMWYQRDFSYQRKPRTRVFFHVGAANYRSTTKAQRRALNTTPSIFSSGNLTV